MRNLVVFHIQWIGLALTLSPGPGFGATATGPATVLTPTILLFMALVLILIALVAWQYHRKTLARLRAEIDHVARDAHRNMDFATTAADWAWEVDSEQRFTYLGDGDHDKDVMGLETEALIGRTRHEVYAREIAEDPLAWEAHFQDIAERKPFTGFEIDWLRPDGQRRIILSKGKPVFDEGIFQGYRGSVQDITDRRLAEDKLARAYDDLEIRVQTRTAELVKANRALAESEERFKDFAATAADCLWETDSELRYVYTSGDDEAILGIKPDELMGRTIQDHYAHQIENQPDRWQPVLSKITAHEPFQDFEVHWERPDGNARILLVSGKPIGQGESFRGYRGAMRDISGLRKAEQNARKHLQELAHSSRLAVMGEMALGLAHELNQPLAGVVTAAEAASRSLQRPDIRPQFLEQAIQAVISQAMRAGNIIRRIRDFVHKGAVDYIDLDVNAVVREVAGLIDHECRDQRITLRLDLDTSLTMVRADVTQLEQVTLNLARNAMDAMAHTEGTDRQLKLRTRHSGPGDIEVTVSDTGIGLPDGEPEQVFETFFSTKNEGMGMGLAISRSIIEALGGTLWAQPNPGGGSTFGYRLPTSEATSDAA